MRSHCRHVAVLIPAHNEEALLRRCLESVLVAGCNLPPELTFDVVVAVDSSTDRTQKIAEEVLCGLGKVICTNARSVGSARAAAASVALKRYCGGLNRCWLANTDADCQVPPNWLTDQLSIANDGAEAIAGTIDVDSFEEHDPGVEQRFRSSYLISPDGSHPHVHGANLGVRADAYLRAGGWAQQTTAEDHDLWKRLRLAGSPTASMARLTVLTSGRRVGRAPLGFAGALAAHNVVAA